MNNILISGVGGQGTVLTSRLIATAAMNKGFDVRTTETIGMAQRGGCVVSHVRIGCCVNSPLLPLKSADCIIGFEPAESVRVFPYLAEDGLVIVCDTPMKPFTNSAKAEEYNGTEMIKYLKQKVKQLIVLDGQKLLKECVNIKTLNVAILGVALESGILPFTSNEMKDVLKEIIPERFIDINLNSFEIGRRMYHDTRNA